MLSRCFIGILGGTVTPECLTRLRPWIPGHEDPSANVLELVKDWLTRKKNGEWLMVIDDANEENFLPIGTDRYREHPSRGETNLRKMEDYIPLCLHGSILVTIRSKKVGTRFAGNALQVQSFQVEVVGISLFPLTLGHRQKPTVTTPPRNSSVSVQWAEKATSRSAA